MNPWRPQWLRMTRSPRGVALLAVYVFFGLVGPLMASYLALVALQYSYLPSWLSFLVDKERAREAGRDLFNVVYGAWSKLPLGQRPTLLVFGESLRSFGAESAFSGVDDIRNRVDGMLLVGPPNRNTLWRETVADRDAGYRGAARLRGRCHVALRQRRGVRP